MTVFFFVRHAYTGLEEEKQKPETRLSFWGREQARLLANRLRNYQVDVIYSSPYKRAVETAEVVKEKIRLPILRDERLREIFLWKNPEELRSYPAIGKDLETFQAHQRERLKFFNELTQKYPTKNLLLVCHGNLIRAILGVTLGMEPETMVRFNIQYTSISILKWRNKGFFELVVLNDAGHLEGSDPSKIKPLKG